MGKTRYVVIVRDGKSRIAANVSTKMEADMVAGEHRRLGKSVIVKSIETVKSTPRKRKSTKRRRRKK